MTLPWFALWRGVMWRPMRRDLVRTLLTVASVALGVAVVVAIDLAGDAATGSFQSSMATLLGTTDLEITANGGIDESWIGKLDALPLAARFEPVIETQANTAPLYGFDFVRRGDPDPGEKLVVSRALAARLGAHQGSRLSLLMNDVPRVYEVSAVVDAGRAEFFALDIAALERALGRYGRLDRIDVHVAPGEDFGKVERTLRELLPSGYTLDRPGVRAEENQRMLRAFRWNLRVLSYISLVVGAFLIYNTIAVSVVRRRGEIGVLRAMGAGRRTVLWLFLGEALMFGVAGSALGVVLGRGLAEGAVGLIAQTVNALYVSSRPAPIRLTAAEAAVGVIAGMLVAFCSALAPAREAMQVPPTDAMGRGVHEHRARLHWMRGLVWSAVLAGLALASSRVPPLAGFPAGGYAAAFLAIGAAAMSAPAVILGVNRMVPRRLFGAVGLLAGRSLVGSLGRTSVMVGALATAIAMMASVGIMVASFRQTVAVWLDAQVRADLFVRPAGRTGAGQFPALSPEVLPLAAGTPGVEAVDDFHALEMRFRGGRATLGAGNIEVMRRHGRLRFLPGQDRDAILASLPGAGRAIVSEPFANHFGIHAGDRISLPLGSRAVPFLVAGVYYEYSSSQGYVILDRSTLLRYLPGQPATNLALYLRRGADGEAVRDLLEKRLAGHRVSIAPNADLRRNALAIFDRTFAITWALEAVAIVVAMLGAANSLLALVLDRRRELGLMRYLGASTPQVRGMVLVEAGYVGLLAVLLGLVLGWVLSLLLIYVVNKQSFGWTIQFHLPAGLLAAALGAVWIVTVFAALYPARVAARTGPLQEE